MKIVILEDRAGKETIIVLSRGIDLAGNGSPDRCSGWWLLLWWRQACMIEVRALGTLLEGACVKSSQVPVMFRRSCRE